MNDKELACWNNENHIVCPHCGHEDYDCFEYREWKQEEDRILECGNCDKSFNTHCEIIHHFTTTLIEEGNTVEI